jgi:PAS domain S-box-containing protein
MTAGGERSMRDLVLEALLDRFPLVVFAYDLDGVCTYLDGAGLAGSRLTPGSLVGSNIFDAYSGLDHIEHLHLPLRGQSASYSWRHGERTFDTWLTPLTDADGRVTGAIGVTLDISEKARVQEDLELHRAFVEAAPQFVALARVDGSVTYVNPGGRRLAGIPEDVDVTRTTIADYLTEEGLRRSLEVEQPAVLEHGSYEGETTLKHWPTGRGIPVRVSSFLVRDELTGEPRALATVQTDVTAQKVAQREAERRLSQQRNLLLHLHEAQETERRRIAGEVHDDTIQAVAAVNIRLQSARRRLQQDGHTETAAMLGSVAESVREATTRLRRLLFDLDAPADLEADLVGALRDHVSAWADEPLACTVRSNLSVSVPPHLARVLFRIAQEAVANARTHAQAGAVTIEVGERDSGFTLKVCDDGRGLPQDLATSARQRPPASPGHLGLRGMAERAESVGGWCSVRPLPGDGTIVEAWVPARLGYAASEEDRPASLALLEQTVESISEGFLALDRDWRYVYVNQVGADIVRRHDLPGKVCWDEFDFSPEVETAYRDAMRLQQPTVARVLYPDLGRWVESRVFPSADGLSVFFRDVTQEQLLEQQAADRQRLIAGGQQLMQALAAEPDLERALRTGLGALRTAWSLNRLSLEACRPGQDPLELTLGAAAPGDRVREVPLVLGGNRIGRVTCWGPEPPGELGSVGEVLALRIWADREPFPHAERSEGHARAD